MIPDVYVLASRALMRLTLDGECWVWGGANDGSGYGALGVYDNGRTKKFRTHRVMYEALVGPIPPGHDLDHLCRNRACSNPRHLEPTTRRENLLRGDTIPAHNARKTHCPAGHPYNDTNTRLERGGRKCRVCCAVRERARRARIEEAS